MGRFDFYRIGLLIGLGVCMYLLLQAWNEDYGQRSRDVETTEAPPVEQILDELPLQMT